jgi:cell division septation protein DedD
MKITWPTCKLEGVADLPPGGGEVVCVRCASVTDCPATVEAVKTVEIGADAGAVLDLEWESEINLAGEASLVSEVDAAAGNSQLAADSAPAAPRQVTGHLSEAPSDGARQGAKHDAVARLLHSRIGARRSSQFSAEHGGRARVWLLPAPLVAAGAAACGLVLFFGFGLTPGAEGGEPAAAVSSSHTAHAALVPAPRPQPAPPAQAQPARKVDAAPAPTAAPTVAPTPEPAKKTPVQAEPAAGVWKGFGVQVGSYPSAAEAEKQSAALKAAGFESRIVSVEIPGRGTWYRVQAGHFGSREEAARNAGKLKSGGVAAAGMVVELGN